MDVSTAPRVRAQIIDAISSGRRWLIIDLTQVTFIDTTGLGVLIGALKRIRVAGGRLRLVTTADAVLRTMRVTGLDRVFETYPSVADAVRGRSQAPSPPSPRSNAGDSFGDMQL